MPVQLAKISPTKVTEVTKCYDDNVAAMPHARPVISVVICTLDEHEAIGGVLSELSARLSGIHHEIIVVDDSTDERTADAVNAYAADCPGVRLVRRYNASGLSSAAITGWDAAKGRFLAIMDGDGQHDPALMKVMLIKLMYGDVDVAVASRYLDDARSGLHGLRHQLSRAGTWLTDTSLGVQLADPLSGCFVMTREWYAQVRDQLSGLGFKILIDIIASGQRRPRMAQVPTLLRARSGGTSKLDTRVVIDLITLLIEKRTRGRLTANAMMMGMATLVTLFTQWLSMAMLLKLGSPLWVATLISVGTGLAGHWWMSYLMTSRSLRPRTLRDAGRQCARFYLRRWSDLPLNAGVTVTLCALRWAWPWAAMVGVLLAEVRYHMGGKVEMKA